MRRSGAVLRLLLISFAGNGLGCGTTANLIDCTGSALSTKAQEMRVAQARLSSSWEERREKARDANCPDQCDDKCHKDKSGKLCHHEGTLEETLETELKIVLENGLQLNNVRLDFEKVQEQAKEQARYDEEYKKAYQAWHDYEAENLRRHMLSETEKAKAKASAEGGGIYPPPCAPCAPPVPDCAAPPPKEYVKSAPPKQKAVGLEEIPIVINANAKLNVGSLNYGKSNVRREFVKAKQPCCPQCGTAGCVNRCDACGFTPPVGNTATGMLPVPGSDDAAVVPDPSTQR